MNKEYYRCDLDGTKFEVGDHEVNVDYVDNYLAHYRSQNTNRRIVRCASHSTIGQVKGIAKRIAKAIDKKSEAAVMKKIQEGRR